MKRLIGSITLLLLISCYLLSCEKDDICAGTTPTTPNLIVTFYYANNHSLPRAVSNLQVYIEGRDTVRLGTTDSIALPLRTDLLSTKWILRYNNVISTGDTISNADAVEFKYTTRQEYVSRACGYKSLFTLDDDTVSNPNPALSDVPGESSLWINEFEVVNKNIENQNEAHIKIFF